MRADRFLWFACLLFAFACKRKVVVYSDPWLEGYAHSVVGAFESENPDVDVELKVISSEVAASHLRFGQPIDILLCFGPEVLEKVGVKGKVDMQHVLASERMAWVEAKDQGKFDQFATRGCLAIEASQRPGRIMTDDFIEQKPEIRQGSCVVIADFQRQMQDYLLRGWVPRGVVPYALVRRHAQALDTLATSATNPEAYSAFLTRHAANNPDAGTFFSFLKSKKSQEILAQQGLYP